jgi:aromatic ring-cleaving dioxygenase
MAAMMGLLHLVMLALADAHSHPTLREEGCTCEPGARPFESYHIHVLFYPDGIEQFSNNTHNSKYARALRKAFIERFNVPECDTSHIFNLTKLCAFAVDATGAGGVANAAPFVAPNFAIFVPVDRYMDAVPWMMANRGNLDFLVHPNSCGFACSPQDHLLWSVWGGNKWPVRFELPSQSLTSSVMV